MSMSNLISEVSLRAFITNFLQAKLEQMGKEPIEISDHTRLVGSGLLDSLGFLELLSALETEYRFEIDLSENDPNEFLTMSGFVHVVSLQAPKNS